VRRERDGVLLDVQVVPRASRERIGPIVGNRLKVQLTAPPVDGEANEALRALLARTLGVSRAAVEIVNGLSGRRKTVRVSGADARAIADLTQGDA
jgi:uncharacterized protein (TIGR00251 family)